MGHVIFDAFANPTWRDIDDEWIRGEIRTSERARRQFALVTAREPEFLRLFDKHAVDPAFPALVADLRAHDIPVQVVSDGFDAYVKPMLAARACPTCRFNPTGSSSKTARSSSSSPTNAPATTPAAAGRPVQSVRYRATAGASPTPATA